MNDKDWWGWFGLKKVQIYSWPVGPFITILVFLLIFSVAVLTAGQTILALIGYADSDNSIDQSAIARNYALIAAALIGFPLIIWRTSVAQKQVYVSEQGQITDRINKAVEGLGSEKIVKEVIQTPRYQHDDNDWVRTEDGELVSATRPDGTPIIDREILERTVPNIEVRIGAIYALERIAQDSMRDHIQIMEILSAYVRENSPCNDYSPTENLDERPKVRTDIQAAISVIGRRNEKQLNLEQSEKFRLDLRNSDLSGVHFREGNFSAAMFHQCKIEASIFNECQLHGTQFFYSTLNYTSFFNANLVGTRFDFATINQPKIPAGGMSESITLGNIYGASFIGADISEITYLGTPDVTKTTFGSRDTKLNRLLDFDRKKYKPVIDKIRKLTNDGQLEEADNLRLTLEEEDFVYWCPFDSDDGALGWYQIDLYKRLDLDRWPYRY